MNGMERQSSLRGSHIRPRLIGPRSRQSSSARTSRSQTTTPPKEPVDNVQAIAPTPSTSSLPALQTQQLDLDQAPLLTPIPPSPSTTVTTTESVSNPPSERPPSEHPPTIEHTEELEDILDDEPAPRYSTVIDRPDPEPPAFSLTPSPSMSPSPAPSLTPKPPLLTPIPPISLDPPPLPYKGMSLQTAQWTLTSEELQTIVSRTIRSSARESFIRLLKLDVLDTQIPADMEHFESARLQGGARLRWLTHRRGMLLQALLSSTVAGGESAELVASLAQQLHALAVEADSVTQSVLRATTSMAQAQSLTDVHSASALSIALRKLNTSFAKRTEELLQARQKISELECQVEDAWAAAEKVAKEADEEDDRRLAIEAERAQWAAEREQFEQERQRWEQERKELMESQVVNVHHPQLVNVHNAKSVTLNRKSSQSTVESDEFDEQAEIQRAEVMFMPKSPPPTLGHMRSKSSLTFGREMPTTTFEFVPASNTVEKTKISIEIPEAPASVTSPSITPSTPSRSRSQSRTSQVAAAKRRSRQPSLRLPRALSRRSAVPPVPNIPQDVKADGDESSETETDEELQQLMRIARLGERASAIITSPVAQEEPMPRPSSSLAIHRPSSMDSHITGGIVGLMGPPKDSKAVDDIGVFNKVSGPSANIPSLWSQADERPGPLGRNMDPSYFPPADTTLEPVRLRPPLSSRFSVTPGTERPPEGSGSSSTSAQHKGLLKLKGLTKRYSLPFPVFTGSGHGKDAKKSTLAKRDDAEVVEEEGGGIGSSPLIRVHKA